MPQHWLITWQNEAGNRDYAIREVAGSPTEAAEAVARILTGFNWTPEEVEEIGGPFTEPAPAAITREYFDGDLVTGVERMRDKVTFVCDDGTITIEHTA